MRAIFCITVLMSQVMGAFIFFGRAEASKNMQILIGIIMLIGMFLFISEYILNELDK